MDVQIPPVFYRTSSSFGAEALLTPKATINKLLSRARVPMTISCLWATVLLLFLVWPPAPSFPFRSESIELFTNLDECRIYLRIDGVYVHAVTQGSPTWARSNEHGRTDKTRHSGLKLYDIDAFNS